MITEVPGLRVGHHTDSRARTGCTVVLGDAPFVASGEVRGSAPATREFALLDPMATVGTIDAVVLSGGSAFGLAASDGVMSWLEERGRGFPTAWGRVPIVVGMSLFDLPVGDPGVRPTAADGRAAAAAASRSSGTELGMVGAGTGATVSKWRTDSAPIDAGLVGAVVRDGEVVVACLVAVNAYGDIVGSPASELAEPAIADPEALGGGDVPGGGESGAGGAMGNTTIGVVATNTVLDKLGCSHLARGAHDGLARSISPPHASVDGDAFVAISTGVVRAPQDLVRWMTVQVIEAAIRSAASNGARH